MLLKSFAIFCILFCVHETDAKGRRKRKIHVLERNTEFNVTNYESVSEVRVLPGEQAQVMEGSLVYFPDEGANAWVRVVVEDVSRNIMRREYAVNCLTRPLWRDRYGKHCRGFLPMRKPYKKKRSPRKAVLVSKAGLILENVQHEDSGLYRPALIRDGKIRLKKGAIYALHVFVHAEFD